MSVNKHTQREKNEGSSSYCFSEHHTHRTCWCIILYAESDGAHADVFDVWCNLRIRVSCVHDGNTLALWNCSLFHFEMQTNLKSSGVEKHLEQAADSLLVLSLILQKL
jgi:hypothetical protein